MNRQPESEVAEVSEPIKSDEDELLELEADDDTPIEADDTAETDESANQDMEILDYSEWSKYALEIGGKTYTGSQLKSALGRLDSAGKDAREADQLRKDYEAKTAVLAQQEIVLKDKFAAAGQVDQLGKFTTEAKRIQTAMAKAREEGDMYELTQLKDRMDQVGGAYRKAKVQVDNAKAQMEQKTEADATAAFKAKGLGYLVEDTPQARAWSDYASSSLTETEIHTAARSPGLAEIIQKAMKYDNARAKTPKKALKTSGKTLRPGQNPTTSTKAKKAMSEDDYFIALAQQSAKDARS